jgi:hypothetical protein
MGASGTGITDQERIEQLRSKARKDQTTGCLIWLGKFDRDGYPECYHDYKTHRAHRLIFALCNPGTELKGLVVRHMCNNRGCIEISHLRSGTQGDNVLDRQSGPNAQKGSNHGMAKLTEEKVIQARSMYATGRYTQTYIADHFGVALCTMSHILKGEGWETAK